jgi:hypothetical protein
MGGRYAAPLEDVTIWKVKREWSDADKARVRQQANTGAAAPLSLSLRSLAASRAASDACQGSALTALEAATARNRGESQ